MMQTGNLTLALFQPFWDRQNFEIIIQLTDQRQLNLRFFIPDHRLLVCSLALLVVAIYVCSRFLLLLIHHCWPKPGAILDDSKVGIEL